MKKRSLFWAVFNFIFGVGIVLLIFLAVPDPETWLKIFGVITGIVFVVNGFVFLINNKILYWWGIITNSLFIIAGLVIVAGIINSAIYLKGIYGPMGEGASAVMWALVALFTPYLVIFPAIQLHDLISE